MRIGVIGAGGVGGYFGARLARGGADVSFVARGAHLRAIQQDGLRIDAMKTPLPCAPSMPPRIRRALGPWTWC